jgi:hypothetical protein
MSAGKADQAFIAAMPCEAEAKLLRICDQARLSRTVPVLFFFEKFTFPQQPSFITARDPIKLFIAVFPPSGSPIKLSSPQCHASHGYPGLFPSSFSSKNSPSHRGPLSQLSIHLNPHVQIKLKAN